MAPGIAWQDTISSKDQRGVVTQGLCILTSRPPIFYWACLGLETLPQFFELGRVSEEGEVLVDYLVGEDRLPAEGGRDVGARRRVPCFGLLLGREVRREEQFGGVRMRRGLEDGRGERPDGKRIGLREGDGLRQTQIFLIHADAGDGIEGDSVSSAK